MAAGGFASTGFNPTAANEPADVATGDFNADGKMDFVVATDASKAHMFLGNGDGTFSSGGTYATAQNTTAVATGDFNGDGKLDFVTADRGSYVNGAWRGEQASVYINNGDGTFPGAAQAEITQLDFNSVFSEGEPDPDPGGGGGDPGPGDSFPGGPTSISNPDISTKEAASDAIDEIAARMRRISLAAGAIGAVESRLQVALSSLQSSRENFTAAQSRITDADVARETAQYTKAKITQQMGAAVLAQANLMPALALKLLKGD